MVWHILGWPWLVNAAVGGLIVLAVGGLAVRLCRQPVRRARLVILTMLGALLVPWLGMTPLPFSFRLPVSSWWWAEPLPSVDQARPHGPATTSLDGVSRTDLRPGAIASGPLEGPVDTTRIGAIAATTRSDPGAGRWASTALETLATLSWRRTVLLAYALTSGGLLAWWLLGQAVLGRVSRGARPARQSVRDRFLAISGPGGEHVRLLESDRIVLPFTFTWTRPVILLPSALCGHDDDESLQYALAHEWSHVERRDAWAWNLAAVAGILLFYQPLFWWLRRQLQLCQDYLADDRAATIGSPEDYAACLVRFARDHGRAFRSALPAMGIYDRPSNLSRRVIMLVNDRDPIEQRCAVSWTFGALAAMTIAIFVAAGLRVDATPAELPKAQPPRAQPAATKAEPKGETLHYSGTVKDKDTGKPIAGAIVTVRREDSVNQKGNRIIEETRHTTNAEGVYSFTIPPEQVAMKRLYIELDVEHPDYVAQAGFGYGLALIRSDEAKGQRPFFENITLRPARAILGRVESPDGKPVEGAEIVAYSLMRKVQAGPREDGSSARAKTDRNGQFRVPIITPGVGAFWILPKDHAPEMHAIPEGRRGDLGTFIVKTGTTVKGRAFDAQGKPLAGLFVTIGRDRDSSPDREILESLAASDMIGRQAETDAEGRFAFDPLPAGVYIVQPEEDWHVPGKGWIHRPLPGVFAPLKLTIQEGQTVDPIEIRATPYIAIEGGWVDSKGKPRGGSDILIIGHIDGQTWHTMVQPSADGKFAAKVPHGMEDVQITLFLGSFASTRYRIGKDAKLQAGQYVMFGKRGLDHDVKDLQIVRYDETAVIVKATTKDGRPIKDVTLAGNYTSEIATAGGGFLLKNGESSEIVFGREGDGRFRATRITPDRELKITADVDGFKPTSRTVRIPEGKTEEVTFVMDPK